MLGILGRSDDAIANQEITIRFNPLYPSIFSRFSSLALAHDLAGRYDVAIKWSERAIHLMPRCYIAHFDLAASHVALDQHHKVADAVKACRSVLADICIRNIDRAPLKDPKK